MMTCDVRMMNMISKYIDEIMVYTRSNKDVIDISKELDINNPYSQINLRLNFISDALLCSYLDIPDTYFTKVRNMISESIAEEDDPVILAVLRILQDKFAITTHVKKNVVSSKLSSWWHFLFGN